MKKFLIVIPDAILLSVFKSWVFRARKKETLVFAKDSHTALQILTTQPIDLLITPLSLSGIDGIELITDVTQSLSFATQHKPVELL